MVLVVMDLRLKKQVAFLYTELPEEEMQVGKERWLNLHILAILAEVGNGFEERIDLV